MTGQLMTVKQFGERIGVSHATAKRKVRAGEVKVINIGSPDRLRFRITEADFERYVESKRVQRRGRAA